MDFRDLNDVSLKDNFSLIVTELIIDTTTCHRAFLFMDCIKGYNQIRMALENQEATTFVYQRA